MVPPSLDLTPLGPTLALVATGVVVLLLGLFVRSSGVLAGVGIIGVIAALGLSLGLWGTPRPAFEGMIVADSLAAFFTLVVLIVVALTLLLSASFVVREQFMAGEYFALVLFAGSGMIALVAASDLIVLIIGLEILSIASYVLTGFARSRATGEEAATKYFLLGAFALGFLVYGSALVYGATGATKFDAIAQAVAQGGEAVDRSLLLVGLGLLLVGFGFKLSLVPFHMWTPDVYEGAPSAISGFMAAGTKAAVFGGFVRVLAEAFPAASAEWAAVLWAIALLSMVVGNVAALVQSNVKRMLAYSSIGQAGYILVAVVAMSRIGDLGASSVMFYVLAYAFMTLGAFGVVVALSGEGDERTNLSDFAGLARRNPLLAAAMGIFMLSLAGIPLTAGFMAKLYVFTAAVQAGYLDLAIVGVLTSAAATYYYLRVIVSMYMGAATEERAVTALAVPAPVGALVVLAIVGTIWLGLSPVFPSGLSADAIALATGQLP